MKNFDLEVYLRNSKALDVSDLAWHTAMDYPLTAGERRCLTYMMDIEAHTIVYLRDLLNTRAIKGRRDCRLPAVLALRRELSRRALERLLRACGTEISPQRVVEVRSALGWLDRFYAASTALLSAASRDFHRRAYDLGRDSGAFNFDGLRPDGGAHRPSAAG